LAVVGAHPRTRTTADERITLLSRKDRDRL